MKQNPSKLKVITEHKTWEFEALSREDAIDWVHHIRQNQNRKSTKSPLTPPTDRTFTFNYEMKKIKHGLMGWLTKRGEVRHTWHRRWCILVPSRVLIYFTDETCQHFKGCADLTGNDMMLLFDDDRQNYFCVQTSTRKWEFSCKTSHRVKHWSLSLQVLHDMDSKALIMKPVPHSSSGYPSKDMLLMYFKENACVRDVLWMAPEKVFVIIFDDEDAIEYYMTQKRLHLISTALNNESPSNASYDSHISDSSSETSIRSKGHLIEKIRYELVALRFSEYMGEVYSALDMDELEACANKSHKTKALSRRFSAKIVRKKNVKKREKASSLVSFTDKYNRSAMAELKRMHSDKTTDDEKETDFDTSEEEEMDTSCDTEDGLPRCIRMTSVTDRGKQVYSHPNEMKTYRDSAIFRFGPSELQQSHTDDAAEMDCAIIIDNGGGYIKAGFEISIEPFVIPNECIESGDAGYDLAAETSGDVIYPMRRDRISDWNAMDFVFSYCVRDRVGADRMNEYPIMMSESPGAERALRDKQLEYWMETHDLHKFYLMNTALANFHMTGKSAQEHCVIVDAGHYTTNISCIWNGMYLRQYGATIARGGFDCTNYLAQAMRNASVYVDLNLNYHTLDAIKRELCYFTQNNELMNKTYVLPDGRSIQIQCEQYEAPEMLFHGAKITSNEKSLHSVLMRCIKQMDDDAASSQMYQNIYCCGGSAKIPNFATKLEYELTNTKLEYEVTVQTMHDAQLSAWYGCAVVLSMNTFADKWITHKDYQEYGQNILFHKCTHQYL